MSWKKIINDYFSFSRRDRWGIVCLLLLIFFMYLAPQFFSKKKMGITPLPVHLLRSADSLKAPVGVNHEDEVMEAQHPTTMPVVQPFPFDPNTLSAEGWQRLGLSHKTSMTIEKYRSKGGKFYKPEDLQRIWGLPHGFYEKVKPYIRIERARPEKEWFPETKRVEPLARPREYAPVFINTADSADFESLPGIGPKLAARIISFREKLGGFYDVTQVAETFGLPDSTFQKIKSRLRSDGQVLRKMDLNTATEDELQSHPYIRWKLARVIVAYRKQHGAFRSVEELQKIQALDAVTLKKIIPYLHIP